MANTSGHLGNTRCAVDALRGWNVILVKPRNAVMQTNWQDGLTSVEEYTNHHAIVTVERATKLN